MTRLLLIAAALMLIPAAVAQELPSIEVPDLSGGGNEPAEDGAADGASGDVPETAVGSDGSDGVDWGSGLVVGVGLGSAGLVALAGIAYYLGVGGLRHVDKHNVLEHPMRQSLLDVVEGSPGVHLRDLAQRHDTAVTNTQWHLRKLEMAGLVKTEKVQGRRLYYPTRGGTASKEKAIQNAAMQNPNAQRIADFLAAAPGINQRSLAEALDMNPGTVRWHLRKMESANIVRCVQDGTQSRYFPVGSKSTAGAWSTAAPEPVRAEQ
jgi:predicted transcriptional regulator